MHTPDTLRRLIEQELRRVGAPGCSIALVDSSGQRWADGFGHADIAGDRPATADTVYRLFSGTKLFTAAAVLQLEERGLLTLDDAVERHVPAAHGAHGVTLRHLLSHRSGMQDTLRAFLAVSLPGATPPTSSEALAAYRIRPVRRPGQAVEYRNVNYALLGAVITKVSGVEYREYVSRNVLAPLGIDASWQLTNEARRRAATGYIGRWDPMRLVLGALFPALRGRLYGARRGAVVELREYDLSTAAIGGLVGSVPEFAKFLQSQLAGASKVLGADATRRMQTQVAEGKAGIESSVGVGLGWKIGRAGSHLFLNHEGGGAGFTTELRLYPEAGIGVALAMNMMRMPATMRAAHRIAEAVRELGCGQT